MIYGLNCAEFVDGNIVMMMDNMEGLTVGEEDSG